MDAKEFLRRMEQGDPTVFIEVMKILRPLTVSACNATRIPHMDREDVVQEVALKVFRKWQTFGARSKLSTWIYAIAYHHCLDLNESRKNAPDFIEPPDDPDNPNGPVEISVADPSHGDPDHTRCIQKVLAELEREPPPRDNSVRRIDLLRFWVETHPSGPELAAFLKTETVQDATQRKHYAWQVIKRLCAKHCGTDECELEQGLTA